MNINIKPVIAFVLVAACADTWAAKNAFELTYFSITWVREESVSRTDYQRLTLCMRPSDDVTVHYNEWSEVDGAIGQMVRTKKTSINGVIGLLRAESFAGGLMAIISELPQEEMQDSGYYASLMIMTDGHRVRRSYYTPPEGLARNKLHSELDCFIRALYTEHGLEKDSSWDLTESDTDDPAAVTLTQIMQTPDKFHGFRVRVDAFLVERGLFYLASDEGMDFNFSRLVELGSESAFLYDGPPFADLQNGQWVTIEGVFILREAICRSASGIIDRITRLEVLPAGKTNGAIGDSSKALMKPAKSRE